MLEPELRPSPRYWRLLQLTVLLCGLPLVVAAVVVAGVTDGATAALAAAAVVLAGIAVLLASLHRRYLAWSYVERDDDLLVRRGVLIRRLTVVPYGRMQFIDVTAGPLERALGLATVQLHTAAAATEARIPGLEASEAARLRDQLAALGEARAAGL